MNRSPQASLSRSALAVLAGGAFAAAAALATRLLLARAVDPAGFGRLTLAIALATATGGLAGLGLNAAAARRVAQLADPRQAAASARTAVVVATIAGAAGATLFLGAGALLARSASWAALGPLLLAVAPIVLSLAVGNACLGVARGRGDAAGRALLRDGLGGLWRLLGVGLAIAWVAPRREAALGFGFALGSVAAEATFLVYVERRGWLARLPGQARDRSLLRSLPDFAGLAALAQAAQWFDVVLLGVLAPAPVVGLYGVARGIEKTLELANEAAGHRFLPAAAVASVAQPEALQALYRAGRRVALALVWPGAALGLFAPRALLAVLFGAPYVGAAAALRWLAAGLVLSAACGYNDKAAIALGGEATTRRILALALLSGIAAGLALMPAHGASGAALAWGAMLLVQNVLLSAWLWRRRRLAPWGRELAAFVGWALVPTAAAALALDRMAPDPWLALLGVGLVAGGGGLGLLARRTPGTG